MRTGMVPFKSEMTSEVRRAAPWVERLARAGYAARGVLYVTIGVLALMAATGGGGDTTDSRGALREIGQQPFGQLLLILTAVGLAGYAVWRFVQAALDPERQAGGGAKGVAKRVGWFGSGLLHAGLVVYAIGLLTGAATGGRDGTKTWTARLMGWDPFGEWIVIAVGAGAIVFGVREILCAWRAKLDEQLDLSQVAPRAQRPIIQVSRFGIAARGFIFGIVGVFLFVAAVVNDPARAKGMGDALDSLRGFAFGEVLLGIVAVGLIAFAIYDFVEARYRRIRAA